MSDTERVAIGAERRRSAPASPIADEWQFADDEDDITKPEQVLGRGITEVEVEILQRLGINPNDFATKADLVMLVTRQQRRDVEHKSGNKQVGAELSELRQLLQTPPNAVTAQLQDDVIKLKKTVRWARGIIATAIVAVLGSIGTGAAKIYSMGEQNGEALVEMQHLKEGLADLRRDLRDDRARAARLYHDPEPHQ